MMVYVSITGLRLNSPIHLPRFWWHAVRSMSQAQRAEGNISAEARTIQGVHHTRSVWTSRDAMRAYLVAGSHLAAMRAFGAMATGKTFGFDTETVPDWDRIHALWLDQGKEF